MCVTHVEGRMHSSSVGRRAELAFTHSPTHTYTHTHCALRWKVVGKFPLAFVY